MLQATVETRVRFAETDAMGVTYHGNYLPWFEMARVALLDLLGTPYRPPCSHRRSPPVA